MQIMEEDSVQVNGEGQIIEIVINRPKALNALNADVLQGINLAFSRILRDPNLRVITITGAGDRAFVAGADIAAMSDLGPRAIADYVELGQRAMRAIQSARVPVIAALNGYALGGGLELALACDLILASSAAKLGQPEVNLGVIPGFGGTQRLIQRVGLGTAKRLVYTGEVITAEEALRLQLVDKVFEPEQLLSETRKMAETICTKAPLAVNKAKSVFNLCQEQALLSGLRHEVEGFLDLFNSADREEGMRAFMQKREAKFSGR